MEHYRIKIVNMNGISRYIVTERISLTATKSGFHPIDCYPDNKASRVMVTAIVLFGQFT